MTKELKPCPFHKKRVVPDLYHGSNDAQGNWARVECRVCGVSIEAEGVGNQIPIVTGLWNTRYKRTCKIETPDRVCSECAAANRKVGVEFKFCPNCGAEVVDG